MRLSLLILVFVLFILYAFFIFHSDCAKRHQNFKNKLADEILRDSNERGLYNFVESLKSFVLC